MESKLLIIMGFAEFLIYGAVLAFLTVKWKKSTPWAKKLSVKVAGGFAGVRALGQLCLALLYLAMELGLFGLAEEKYASILSVPAGIVDGVTGVYLFAALLLCFMYLGKVQPARKKAQ